MMYAKVENGEVVEYPLSAYTIIQRYPNTSFPIPFEAPDGYEPVGETSAPVVDYTKNVVELEPESTEQGLIQAWTIEDATAEEIEERTDAEAGLIRKERNSLLAESDWTQLPDSTADKIPWAAYRQELRDLTNQPGFPWGVTWPNKPS